MRTEDRRGAADARQGMVDQALDLVDDIDVVAVFGQCGGLHSLRLCDGTIRGGDGNGDDAGLGPWARRLIGYADWLPSNADIFCP